MVEEKPKLPPGAKMLEDGKHFHLENEFYGKKKEGAKPAKSKN